MLIKHQPLEAYFCLLYPSEHRSLCIDRAGGRTCVRFTFFCLLNFEHISTIRPHTSAQPTKYYSIFTIHYALCTVHYALYTMHCLLCTMHYTLCTIHYSIFTMHYALCIIRYLLCIMHYAYVFIHICYFIRIHTYSLFHVESDEIP